MKGSVWWEHEVPEELGPGYVRAVLEAIQDGFAEVEWRRITHGDLEIDVMAKPLAIGRPDDHVILYGMSAELVDLIALELGDVMSPTPLLYDAVSTHPDARWVGPHTLPTLLGVDNGTAGMTKTAAKAHADAVAAEIKCLHYAPDALIVGWGKTYGLGRYQTAADGSPTIRPAYSLEYGWAMREAVSWNSPNATRTGWVAQAPQWAHFYSEFWDYSMAAWYVRCLARLRGEPVDLRELAVDGARAGVVSHTGAVPFVIHPDCPSSSTPPLDALPDTERSPGSVVPAEDAPTLRLGDRGRWVGVWQSALIAAGFSLHPYGADLHFGRLTGEQTRAYQRIHGITADAIVGPKTWATLGEQECLPLSEPFTDAPFPPIHDRPGVFGEIKSSPAPVSGNPEAIKIHGSWIRDHLVEVIVPELFGISGAPRDGGVYFHELGAEQLRELFAAWAAEGLIDRVLSWAGSWVPRYVRGSRNRLSNHAYGSAFDINAPWNPMGAEPAHVGERGSVRELVPIAHDHGFFWGGNYRGRPDGMHFEIGKVL